ncbi:hypothetical protein [Kribbella sp. NPDC006257]|uniref:hypothetical protein n=1 Tax=Kribbella sp. NPDC006257 TaxID=3156738 RepID=UPI0033AE27B9
MTAQPNHEDQQPAEAQPDPIGPINLPKRLRIGARAFALVGAASTLAVGVIEVTDGCSTFTTIHNPN